MTAKPDGDTIFTARSRPLAQEQHSPIQRWFRLFERVVMPGCTAAVSWYLLKGILSAVAEQLPEPWADVLTHSFVEYVLIGLSSLAYFLAGLFFRKLARHAITWILLMAAAHFLLARYWHPTSRMLYLLWCLVLWGATVLLTVRLGHAAEAYAYSLENSSNDVPYPQWVDEDGKFAPVRMSADDIFGHEGWQVLLLQLFSALVALTSSFVLGIALWRGVGRSPTASVAISLFAGLVAFGFIVYMGRNREVKE